MREVRGTVLNGTGGIWTVRTSEKEDVNASLRGRLKKEDATMKLAVGDEVTIARESGDDAWAISEIHPRHGVLARKSPGKARGERDRKSVV